MMWEEQPKQQWAEIHSLSIIVEGEVAVVDFEEVKYMGRSIEILWMTKVGLVIRR